MTSPEDLGKMAMGDTKGFRVACGREHGEWGGYREGSIVGSTVRGHREEYMNGSTERALKGALWEHSREYWEGEYSVAYRGERDRVGGSMWMGAQGRAHSEDTVGAQ